MLDHVTTVYVFVSCFELIGKFYLIFQRNGNTCMEKYSVQPEKNIGSAFLWPIFRLPLQKEFVVRLYLSQICCVMCVIKYMHYPPFPLKFLTFPSK